MATTQTVKFTEEQKALIATAGFTASQMLEGVPLLEKPYTTILADIDAKRRKFNQARFGPDTGVSSDHLCKTAMCTAGHLVNMAGGEGVALLKKHGFAHAAALIHAKAHPDHPCQNFGVIKDEFALAYIRKMAAIETAPSAAS